VWKGGHDLVLSVGQARFAEHGIGPTAVTGARVAAHTMQHAAYSVQHATCSMQHDCKTCRQHSTCGNMQHATCPIQHTACSAHHAECAFALNRAHITAATSAPGGARPPATCTGLGSAPQLFEWLHLDYGGQ
jgi:hypothetical protein